MANALTVTESVNMDCINPTDGQKSTVYPSLPRTVKSNAHSTWDMYTLYTLGAVYLESLRAQARTEASFVQQDAEEMVYFHSRAKI